MKSKLLSLIASFALSLPLAAQSPGNPWTLSQFTIQLPAGTSRAQLQLPLAQLISPFRIVFAQTAACPGFQVNPLVQYQGATSFSAVGYANTLFSTDNKPVQSIDLTFNHNRYPSQTCAVTIQSFAQQKPQPTPPDSRIFVGTLNHAGGFAASKSLTFSSFYLTQEISLDIPAYCAGYEVDQLQVISEGSGQAEQYPTLTAQSSVYTLPKAALVRGIKVRVLAPEGQRCQIPVYIRPLTTIQSED